LIALGDAKKKKGKAEVVLLNQNRKPDYHRASWFILVIKRMRPYTFLSSIMTAIILKKGHLLILKNALDTRTPSPEPGSM